MKNKRFGKHLNRRDNRSAKNGFVYHFKWFVFWTVVYFILIWLFDSVRSNYGLFEKPMAYFLILGLYLRIVSKFVFCAVKKRTFTFGRIFSWTVIYALLLFIIDFLINQFDYFSNFYANLLITSIIFTIVVMFLRRANMKFGSRNGRSRRTPSQIFTGIILIVFGILCWRFSKMVFVDWFGWPEGMAWSLFIGFALIVAGFLVLLAWWRNNVLQHRFGLKIGKWN